MKERCIDNPLDLDGGISPALHDYLQRREIAMQYDSYFRGMTLFQLDTCVLDALFREKGRLLDLGCGTGRHLLHFARRGFDVTGVDLSLHMIDVARRKLEAEGLAAKFVTGNFCDLSDLESGSFDYAISMFSTLGMVRRRRNRVRAVAEAARVLRPGGTFVVHAHNLLHSWGIPGGTARLARTLLNSLTGRGELGDVTIDPYRGVRNMFLHCYRCGELASDLGEGGLGVQRMLYINEARDGLLNGLFLRRYLANGFIAIAGKPVNRA